MQVSSRLNYVFWQENPTQIVTRGVAKGLLADEKYKAEYDYSYKVYDEVASIADTKNNSVVYLGPIMLETGIPTWLYLENRNSVDSLSVWLGDPRLSDRQKGYYEIHKNKPKYVYIDNKVKNNGLLEVYSENEYNKHNLTDGILLEKK